MGQIKFVAAILFLAVFTIALISYVSNYAVDNNANINLADDSLFVNANRTLQSEMVTFRGDINSSSSGFTQSTTEAGSDTLKSPSVFQSIGFSVNSVTSVLELMRVKVFGGNPAFFIILSVISTFFVFVAFMYIWKTFKGGNPD